MVRVKGEGPDNARIMFVGEASGRDEDRVGRPFVGAAGRELNRFLESVGIKRRDCYVTNVYKSQPPGNRDPSPEEIAGDAGELWSEITRINPAIVVPLGRIAARQFLGDVDVEDVHGIPHAIDGRIIFTCYHPAAGLHSPDLQAFLQYDFDQLRLLLDGKLAPSAPIDQFPSPAYILQPPQPPRPYPVSGPNWLSRDVMAIDTEGVSGRVWGLSYTIAEGQALVVRAADGPGLALVQQLVDRVGKILLHNALHDLPILAEMGIQIPIGKTVDTMVMAYILCLEPQGLKPLARRHCGMAMQSYPEIVREADRRIAREYLERVVAARVCQTCLGVGAVLVRTARARMAERKCPTCDGDGTLYPKPETQLVRNPDGQLAEYNPQSIGRKIRKTLLAMERSELAEFFDARGWWNDQEPETRAAIEAVVGPIPLVSLDDVEPPEAAIHYSARDADATLRVYHKLQPKIDAMALGPILQMDMDILPMVDRMQRVGWLIDIPHFDRLTTEFEGEIGRLERRLRRLAGHYVNPGSPKQVADLLFRELELPPLKLTKSKTRESTDDKTLESLSLSIDPSDERTTQILDTILHYRELQKLVGTYTRPLPLWADGLGRVHSHFRVTRTASGRLSSFEPNFQNIPIKAKRGRDNGKRIRAGFVCREGWRLGSWDLSQIEMRILAHVSGDLNLIRLFVEGENCPEISADGKCLCHDIHLYTSGLIYRKPVSEVTANERLLAKNVGFGIVYGITSKGLQAQMELRGQHWTEEECQDMIDAYLSRAYPGVRDYMMECEAEARRFGLVRDMFGRVRYLPAVHSTASWVASEAVRQAGNHGIQAGAQGVAKLAMLAVWRVLELVWGQGFQIEPLAQVHDELIFEFEDGLEDLIDPMIKKAFAEAVQLRVPIVSQSNFGLRWSDLK